MRNETNALIFDVDGTLAETEELHRRAFNDVFKKKGLNWYWDKPLYTKLLRIAGGKERIKFYQTNISKHNRSLGDHDVSLMHKEKTQIYASLVENGALTLRPGIHSIITNALEKKILLAIATSTSHSNVIPLTQSCFGKKPAEIFSYLATGDLVKRKKPAADLYHLVLQKMSLKPTECLAIEDSGIGLMAAKAANIRTLVSPSFYHMSDDFTEADYICAGFEREQLPKEFCQLLFQ
jgi:HAD superfamily hydrolase (TIGR01509 family)